jgi:hypothetical protein
MKNILSTRKISSKKTTKTWKSKCKISSKTTSILISSIKNLKKTKPNTRNYSKKEALSSKTLKRSKDQQKLTSKKLPDKSSP